MSDLIERLRSGRRNAEIITLAGVDHDQRCLAAADEIIALRARVAELEAPPPRGDAMSLPPLIYVAPYVPAAALNDILASLPVAEVSRASVSPEALVEAVRNVIRERHAAQARIAALEEALRFYADPGLDGYDARAADYGLTVETGHIIKDGGAIARAALAESGG